MTDSNINNLLNNNEDDLNSKLNKLAKEENTNEQPVDTNLDNQIVNSSFTNVFKETNYTPTFNFDDYISNLLCLVL